MTCTNTQKKLCGSKDCNKCFNRSFASSPHLHLWAYEKNINMDPYKISKSSHVKYWFKCDECPHYYDMALNNVKAGCSCCYCDNKKLCDEPNCLTCFEKSFATHPKVILWSVDNILSAKQVYKNSNNKYKFDCIDCGHQYITSLSSVIRGDTNSCLYCSNLKLCEAENCQTCFDKSLASHLKSVKWSSKNKLFARQVFKCSAKIAFFYCNTCCHEYEEKICNASARSYCTCPYCCGSRLCGNDNCRSCLEKSFASHEKSKYWHSDNNISPQIVFKCSQNKYKFQCDKCQNTFMMRPAHITREHAWCGNCKNKTEGKLYDWLLKTYPELEIINNAKFEWCRSLSTDRCYPFDFVIEDYKLIIELDGQHHFEKVTLFKSSLAQNQERDIYKMKRAIENGYSMIRISQEDVHFDRGDWQESLKSEIHAYTNPSCVFIKPSNRYSYDHLESNIS